MKYLPSGEKPRFWNAAASPARSGNAARARTQARTQARNPFLCMVAPIHISSIARISEVETRDRTCLPAPQHVIPGAEVHTVPLRPQSIVLWSGFVLAAGHLVFLGALAWLLLFGAGLPAEAPAAPAGANGLAGSGAGQPPWWTLLARLPSAPAALACGLAGILAVSGLGVVAGPLVGRLFRRTSAPELFFLMLFLASLSLEVWRAANLLFHLLPVPAAIASAATRAVLFGRLFGLSCLLAGGLDAAGLK